MKPFVFILALVSLAAPHAGCSKCAVDCTDGYEPLENSCICRPIPDSGAADRPGTSDGATDAAADAATDAATDAAADAPMLASCVTSTTCGSGSMCVLGCPISGPPRGICSAPGRDTCGCGGVIDICVAAGTVCLMPACCDFPGICVTPAERADICARPEGARFDCAAADAGL